MFKKGQSGNPQGRPKKTDTERALREQLKAHVPNIIDRLVILAEQGDIAAAKIIIDRVIPPLRPVAALAPMPALDTGETLSDKAAAILLALAQGEIGPDAGLSLMNVLAKMREIATGGDSQAEDRSFEIHITDAWEDARNRQRDDDNANAT